jgi:hypothetical protein
LNQRRQNALSSNILAKNKEQSMGYIKDPEGVVLYVEHRQPTPEEDREVSEYIARNRAQRLAAQRSSEAQTKEKSLPVGAKKRSQFGVVV